MTTIISIDYAYFDEKVHYEKIVLTFNNLNDKKEFSSGNFVKDWYDCMKYYFQEISDKDEDSMLCCSSSVYDFLCDGAPFDSLYLHFSKDGSPVLKHDSEDGFEFFVEAGTKPTWEELRELCGDPKKVNSNS